MEANKSTAEQFFEKASGMKERVTHCTITALLPIHKLLTVAGLAQSVERLTTELEVVGSIPWTGPLLRVLK